MHLEEGRRQTLPLDEVARICRGLQRSLLPHGYAFVPLCVQYGPVSEVQRYLAEANGQIALHFPIVQLHDVDWTDLPHQQAAFYVAMREHASHSHVPSLAFGNASTYLHLILAATGSFDLIAIALHNHQIQHARDGREYWEYVAAELPTVCCFRQQQPDQWSHVSEAIEQYLWTELRRWLQLGS